MTPSSPQPVLLFDGECGLCNRVVRLLLRIDGEARLQFAPLQSQVGQAFLRAHHLPTQDFDSLVLVPDWNHRDRHEFLMRTEGVLAALRLCGPIGEELAAVLNLFPVRWRDAGYKWVARWRYRIFGEWQPRPLARPEWSERFLA